MDGWMDRGRESERERFTSYVFASLYLEMHPRTLYIYIYIFTHTNTHTHKHTHTHTNTHT